MRWRRHIPRTPRAGETDARPLLDDLQEPVSGPDFVPAVMGQLGYMRAAPRVTRRRRIGKLWRRAAWLTLAVCTIGVGTFVLHHGPESRRPTLPTISEAMSNDVQRQQDGIGSVIRTIRRLTPLRPAAEPAAPSGAEDSVIDPDVDRSAVAHVQWV